MISDICYLAAGTTLQVAPYKIMGTCTGVTTLAQKVLTLALADPGDAGRGYGGGLCNLAIYSTVNPETVRNQAQIAVAAAVALLQAELAGGAALPESEQLSSATVSAVASTGKNSMNITITALSVAGAVSSATTAVATGG